MYPRKLHFLKKKSRRRFIEVERLDVIKGRVKENESGRI